MSAHIAVITGSKACTQEGRAESKRQAQYVKATSISQVPLLAPRGANWLSEALLEMSPTRPQRRVVDVLSSAVLHGLILGAAILLPLYFSESIDIKQFTQTLLVAPPPPPPPPAVPMVAKIASMPRRVFTTGGKLLAPTVIPQKVAMLSEEALAPEIGVGVEGGVPGGVPGGQMGGVIGGIVSGSRSAIPAPPAVVRAKIPLRVGGDVKAPRCIRKVEPLYPALAKDTRLQGQVVIDAVIDEQGIIVEMRVVSGHPLLVPSALDAVRKWKYEPTYLNGQPIAVDLVVTVNFQLASS
jgi:periplasmic protein TonB